MGGRGGSRTSVSPAEVLDLDLVDRGFDGLASPDNAHAAHFSSAKKRAQSGRWARMGEV